jgi:predicted lipid-binding transport protein (Tim44 family)
MKLLNGAQIAIGILLCFVLILPCLADDHDSPQTVFKAAQAAGAQKDFKALAQLVAPSEHALFAFGSDMGVGMFVEFYEGAKAEEMKKKYQEIQEKYGVKDVEDEEKLQINNETPQEVIDEHIRKRAQKKYGHVNVVEYVPALMGLVVNMPEMAEQSFFPKEALTDLKIEEDKATGKAGEKEIVFVREEGKWYLSADVMN